MSFQRHFWPTVITYVAVSQNGKWLAAGTCCGAVTICNQGKTTSCRNINAGRGVLDDLRFSPSDRFLAVANKDITFVAVDGSERSFTLCSDGRNYGTVRFNGSGTELLTIDGQSKIQLIDIRSRATVSTICCSSVYGEVAFGPGGADGHSLLFGTSEGTVEIWDIRGRPHRRAILML